MKATFACVVMLLVSSCAFAQPIPTPGIGRTFVALDTYVQPNDDATLSHYGWALKCNGTILGVNTYVRHVGSLQWIGYHRNYATFHSRPDVVNAFTADIAGANRCANPTEYAGFEVRLPASGVIGTYDWMVCVEDSERGRGVLAVCSLLQRVTRVP